MADIKVNGETRSLTPGFTVGDLLRDLVPAGRRVAVELNGEILPRDEHAARALSDGDALEIVQAIGGG